VTYACGDLLRHVRVDIGLGEVSLATMAQVLGATPDELTAMEASGENASAGHLFRPRAELHRQAGVGGRGARTVGTRELLMTALVHNHHLAEGIMPYDCNAERQAREDRELPDGCGAVARRR
jgi:hypothetical protein